MPSRALESLLPDLLGVMDEPVRRLRNVQGMTTSVDGRAFLQRPERITVAVVEVPQPRFLQAGEQQRLGHLRSGARLPESVPEHFQYFALFSV
jgi:hypothetical protein